MISKQMPIKFTEKERRKEKINKYMHWKDSKSTVQSPNKKLESQKARDKAS